MKKVLITLLLMLAMSANAQINNLDEIEIQGKWDVYGFGGSFSNFPFEYRLGNTPKYLELKDGNYTRFNCFLPLLITIPLAFSPTSMPFKLYLFVSALEVSTETFSIPSVSDLRNSIHPFSS